MSQAPDYDTIFDVEHAVETAVKAVLASFGIAGFTQMETTDLPRERVDIQLQLGGQRPHRGLIGGGQHCRDSWDGTLVFNVWTPRMESDGNGQQVPADPRKHGKFRGRIRWAVEHFAGSFTEALLPYHSLVSIEQINTDPTINLEDDLDVSALQFRVIVGVRTGAWPAIS